MAHCPKCGEYVNNPGQVCGACNNAMKNEAELTRLKIKETKKNIRNNSDGGGARFHGLYCLCIGWWLAIILACCIVPLCFAGGRRLIKKAFGIW